MKTREDVILDEHPALQQEQRLSAPVSALLVQRCALASGQRVLDVGCGRGDPALALAHAVGPTGRVVAVDIDPVVVRVLQARAQAAGLVQLTAQVCAAATIDVDLGTFDVVTSRFALMYVRALPLALARLRRVLAPGGLFVAALWGGVNEVAWWRIPRIVTSSFVPSLALAAMSPDEPSAIALGDLARVEALWCAAGFAIETVDALPVELVRSVDVQDVVAWVRQALGAWVAQVPAAQQAAWEQALVDAVRSHPGDGAFALGGLARVVVARAV